MNTNIIGIVGPQLARDEVAALLSRTLGTSRLGGVEEVVKSIALAIDPVIQSGMRPGNVTPALGRLGQLLDVLDWDYVVNDPSIDASRVEARRFVRALGAALVDTFGEDAIAEALVNRATGGTVIDVTTPAVAEAIKAANGRVLRLQVDAIPVDDDGVEADLVVTVEVDDDGQVVLDQTSIMRFALQDLQDDDDVALTTRIA
jgi:hypothetical protein